MTSQQIKTTVNYNGGTYTGEIEPYIEIGDRSSSSPAQPDKDRADVGPPAQPDNQRAELINHYDKLIRLIQDFNLNENKFLQRQKVYIMHSETKLAKKIDVNAIIDDLKILLTTIDYLTINLNEQSNTLTKISEIVKFTTNSDAILDKDNAIEINREKFRQYNVLKSEYEYKLEQLQSKKGGFNKRRYSRHHLTPSLKKRKHLAHSHSTTRRKHN
jgi:hypothetical protein